MPDETPAVAPDPAPVPEPEFQPEEGVADEAVGTVQRLPLIIKEAKAGYKTTEFWLTLAGALLTQLGALRLPGKYGDTIATVALIVSYALSRGIAKAGVPNTEVGL